MDDGVSTSPDSGTEHLRRELEMLRQENVRLTGVEVELAAALESLRVSEERLRLAVAAARMGLWEWDMLSNRVRWDAKQHEVFGVPYGSFGGTKDAFFELVHPDDRPMLAMALTRAVDDGEPYRNEFRIVAPDGKTRWIANLGQVHRDDNGRPLRMIGMVYDVTDRKQVEQELRDAHRMDGIGQLAGGFAHHFNNLLTVIVGHVDMALELAGGEAVETDLQVIRQAAQRGTLLTRQLLTFAGKQIIVPRVVNLNDEIERMTLAIGRLVGEDIRFVAQLTSGLWNVTADPGQLDLLLMNLAVNAQQAMPEGGTLTIATANVGANDEYVPRGAEVMTGDYVMIVVSDTGTGMPEEIAQQVFEPFFTTKGWGSDSTGLGLSTCYGIVAQQGGHIRVHTRVGEGSTFRVYFPRLPLTEVNAEPAATLFARVADTMTVLVVDDEAGVRKLVSRILRTRGFSVLEAASGAEALDIARAWHGRIHLLITDIVMPEMNGWELARQLRNDRAGVETLYISGYSETAAGSERVVMEKAHFLQKPFAAGALVQKVRQLLDVPKE